MCTIFSEKKEKYVNYFLREKDKYVHYFLKKRKEKYLHNICLKI